MSVNQSKTRDNSLEGRVAQAKPVSIILVPFSKNASQEYARPGLGAEAKGGTGAEWLNVDWHDQRDWSNWENTGWKDKDGYSISKITPESRLGSLIRIRQDNDRFGFVQDCNNGTVFYADTPTISLLRSMLDKRLADVREEHPEVLKALLHKV